VLQKPSEKVFRHKKNNKKNTPNTSQKVFGAVGYGQDMELYHTLPPLNQELAVSKDMQNICRKKSKFLPISTIGTY
jgi:hypothetical protein